MIESFRSKALKDLWERSRAKGIRPDLVRRVAEMLDALDAAARPADMNLPGYDFHPLRGKPTRYSVHVNGPWTITFEWRGRNAARVDLEQYH